MSRSASDSERSDDSHQAVSRSASGSERSHDSHQAASLVRAYNEWDPLEEVIVGSAGGAQISRPDRGLFTIFYHHCETPEAVPSGPFPRHVVEETEEELAALGEAFEDLGITVRRPAPVDPGAVVATPLWETEGFYDHAPRDTLLVVGETVIEAPMVVRAMQHKLLLYKDLLLEYFASGARWISAPRPRLADEMYRPDEPAGARLADLEPCFDAANVIRLGTDLLYLLSDGGNEMGARWLQSVLGPEYTVHVCRGLYEDAHIDTTIVPIRPGLVLLHPERVTEDNLPPLIKGWDRIWAPEMTDIGYTGTPLNSPWIGMNVFMVRPDLAVVDHRQTALIEALEAHRVDVLPLALTHARTLGGGFHCATLDVRRTGGLETYR